MTKFCQKQICFNKFISIRLITTIIKRKIAHFKVCCNYLFNHEQDVTHGPDVNWILIDLNSEFSFCLDRSPNQN